MKVDLSNSRFGHAPNHATCKLGEGIVGADEALQHLPSELIAKTIKDGGVLPRTAAIIIAGGCSSFNEGKCTLKRFNITGACVEL